MPSDFSLLLVDDDADDRQIFMEAVQFLGLPVQVHSAIDGLHALEFFQTSTNVPVQIMFFDLNMPRMNGVELLEKVRSDPSYDQIPIVIYSTSSRPEDINQCLRLGANAYLPKPSSFNQLCKDLLEVFKSHVSKFAANEPLS